ncbi:MAG: 30S ribosomal protein S4 [Christensenellales bacterium]|jgi:small subunit ribosomal protein S4
MARYTGSVCRLCRREGTKLFLKGDRCYSSKCGMSRGKPPGQHGQSRKKVSEYGLQLREKQKAKRAYGLQEAQFRKYFKIAEKQKGVTGENLLRLLETRFDNIVYRLGLAASRAQSRQLITHGHFRINGKKVDIPSVILKVGDMITVKNTSQDRDLFKAVKESEGKLVPGWLQADPEALTGTVVALPTRDDIDLTIEEHLIVELYSR